MLLTEIGKLQDKGLNPIFSKRVDIHRVTLAPISDYRGEHC